MTRFDIALAATLVFTVAGCGGSNSKDSGGSTTGTTAGGGGGGGGGGGSDTYDTAALDGSWMPAAVGFELIGGIHEGNLLGPYTFTDGTGPYDAIPFVSVTLTSFAFFGGAEDETCTMLALLEPEGGFPKDGFDFYYPPDDSQFDVVQMANYGSEIGWTGDAETAPSFPYATWTGRLVFDAADDDCTGIVPAPTGWDDAEGAEGTQAFEPFQNMRIGFQIGQHTDYLLNGWNTDETDWDVYGDAMMALYIGINHPDGTFHGEDWTNARFWEANEVLQPKVDEDDYLVPSAAKPNLLPPGSELPATYMNANSRWYQDFPLMDFSVLAD